MAERLFDAFCTASPAFHATTIVEFLVGAAIYPATDRTTVFAFQQNGPTLCSTISAKPFWLDSETMF